MFSRVPSRVLLSSRGVTASRITSSSYTARRMERTSPSNVVPGDTTRLPSTDRVVVAVKLHEWLRRIEKRHNDKQMKQFTSAATTFIPADDARDDARGRSNATRKRRCTATPPASVLTLAMNTHSFRSIGRRVLRVFRQHRLYCDHQRRVSIACRRALMASSSHGPSSPSASVAPPTSNATDDDDRLSSHRHLSSSSKKEESELRSSLSSSSPHSSWAPFPFSSSPKWFSADNVVMASRDVAKLWKSGGIIACMLQANSRLNRPPYAEEDELSLPPSRQSMLVHCRVPLAPAHVLYHPLIVLHIEALLNHCRRSYALDWLTAVDGDWRLAAAVHESVRSNPLLLFTPLSSSPTQDAVNAAAASSLAFTAGRGDRSRQHQGTRRGRSGGATSQGGRSSSSIADVCDDAVFAAPTSPSGHHPLSEGALPSRWMGPQHGRPPAAPQQPAAPLIRFHVSLDSTPRSGEGGHTSSGSNNKAPLRLGSSRAVLPPLGDAKETVTPPRRAAPSASAVITSSPSSSSRLRGGASPAVPSSCSSFSSLAASGCPGGGTFREAPLLPTPWEAIALRTLLGSLMGPSHVHNDLIMQCLDSFTKIERARLALLMRRLRRRDIKATSTSTTAALPAVIAPSATASLMSTRKQKRSSTSRLPYFNTATQPAISWKDLSLTRQLFPWPASVARVFRLTQKSLTPAAPVKGRGVQGDAMHLDEPALSAVSSTLLRKKHTVAAVVATASTEPRRRSDAPSSFAYDTHASVATSSRPPHPSATGPASKALVLQPHSVLDRQGDHVSAKGNSASPRHRHRQIKRRGPSRPRMTRRERLFEAMRRRDASVLLRRLSRLDADATKCWINRVAMMLRIGRRGLSRRRDGDDVDDADADEVLPPIDTSVVVADRTFDARRDEERSEPPCCEQPTDDSSLDDDDGVTICFGESLRAALRRSTTSPTHSKSGPPPPPGGNTLPLALQRKKKGRARKICRDAVSSVMMAVSNDEGGTEGKMRTLGECLQDNGDSSSSSSSSSHHESSDDELLRAGIRDLRYLEHSLFCKWLVFVFSVFQPLLLRMEESTGEILLRQYVVPMLHEAASRRHRGGGDDDDAA